MNVDFEPVMEGLFAALQAAADMPFSANATEGSAVLTGASGFAGLFVGLPVFGQGAASLTTIAALNPGAGTITLTDPLSAGGTDVAFTTGFQTASRRLRPWTEVSAQPALFLRRIGVTDAFEHDQLSITTLECEVWIYCNAGQDPDAAPDQGLTALEQLVRSVMTPDGDYGDTRFTIGGLVYWCRIEGRTDSSDGALGGQAISRIPVRITLP